MWKVRIFLNLGFEEIFEAVKNFEKCNWSFEKYSFLNSWVQEFSQLKSWIFLIIVFLYSLFIGKFLLRGGGGEVDENGLNSL